MERARARLVEWRVRRKEPQKAIGDLVGWDQATVSKFELGKQDADVDQLDAIASHYNRSLSDLFSDLPPESKQPELDELIDLYWRLPKKARSPLVAMLREAFPSRSRPSGNDRRSVRREHASNVARFREDE